MSRFSLGWIGVFSAAGCVLAWNCRGDAVHSEIIEPPVRSDKIHRNSLLAGNSLLKKGVGENRIYL
jgi:hypothetical protein